jgi:hypothetical protein
MKKFLLKTTLLLLLYASILLTAAIFWDPFQVFRSGKSWNSTTFDFNREWVCLDIYRKRIDKGSIPTHFIVGSSRSHAFKTIDWATIGNIPPNSIFHFDAFGMGILRANNLIHYLSNQKPAPKEILWVIDHAIFNEKDESDKFIFSEPPELSGKNSIVFNSKAIYESIHPSFIFRYLKSSISSTNDFEIDNVSISNNKVDHCTGDIYYEKSDLEIIKDSVGYYKRKDVIKKFNKFLLNTPSISPPKIMEEEYKLLVDLEKNLHRNNIKLIIVISPLFSKIKFNSADLSKLQSVFGKNNIYDYSGENHWTKDYRNYYDPSHFRRHVAQQILMDIYKK